MKGVISQLDGRFSIQPPPSFLDSTRIASNVSAFDITPFKVDGPSGFDFEEDGATLAMMHCQATAIEQLIIKKK